MQRPPAREPPALLKTRQKLHPVFLVSPRHVGKVGVALPRFGVPAKHGIDRLGQLSAALLIDTARVDPDPLKPPRLRERAATFDLDEAGPDFRLARVEVLKRHFSVAPSVREDGVLGDFAVKELFESEGGRV